MMHKCGQRRLDMPQMSVPFGLPFHFQENILQVYPHMCKVECKETQARPIINRFHSRTSAGVNEKLTTSF